MGALLRREGLYWSNLQTWRRQREEGTLQALTPRKRGRKSKPVNPLDHQLRQVQAENRKLKRKLEKFEAMLDLQKKSRNCWGSLWRAAKRTETRADGRSFAILTIPRSPGRLSGSGSAAIQSVSGETSAGTPAMDPRPRPASPRALSPPEKEAVVEVLHSQRFVDKAPATVWAELLDEGRYLCSIRTMYRILSQRLEVKERRRQRRHPQYAKPELLATGPNQCWSWDITKLKGPVKWSYYYLYVVLDIFSRYVVGWMVATQENSRLAKALIAQSYSKQAIVSGDLTLHADRGSSMSSKALALLLADLGVTKSHSRPHVCDDNPYSEAQFKTLKYRPEFPARFGTIQQARTFCREFFDWYNRDHRHSGIGLHTPEDVHYLTAIATRRNRAQTLEAAHALFQERFPNGKPVPPALPEAVWINPPEKKDP